MKKVKMLFKLVMLCFLSLTLFSSCEKAGTELKDLMIIQGIGIDKEKDEFKVTVEILNNEQSGSPGGDSNSENKTKIYSATGKNVSVALRELSSKSGNLPLFAHNRVIILSEDVAKENLENLLDFFVRNYDSRASQIICVVKGDKAESVIRAKLLKDTIKSEILENLLEESYNQSLVPRARVVDVINALDNKTGAFCIPAIEIDKNGENEDYKLSGCALLDRTGILEFLDSSEAEGISFLTDSVKNGFLETELADGVKAEFLINKSKTKYKISNINGEIYYDLSVEIVCDLDEIERSKIPESDAQLVRELKEAVQKTVVKKSQKTLSALQSQDGGDAVMYYKRLELQDSASYNKLKGDWKNIFPKIRTRMKVDVTIRRIGEETF